MLVHEIADGKWGIVESMLFVRPPGCLAMRVPGYVRRTEEPDGTLTLLDPIVCTESGTGVLYNAMLVHGHWTMLEVARRSA